MSVRKHSPSFLKKKADNKRGVVTSMPNKAETGFETLEDLLVGSGDLSLVRQDLQKVIQIKTFDRTEVVPTAERVAEIENAILNFLPRSEYAAIEATQKAAFEKLVTDLDIKDLDVEAFMAYWAQAAKIADITRLDAAMAAQNQVIAAQNQTIIALQTELSQRVHSEINFVGGEVLKNEAGKNYVIIPVPAEMTMHCVRVYRDGLKVGSESYTNTTDAVVFEIEISSDEKLDFEISLKKK